MGEWREYKLGDISEVASSKRIFYSDYVSEGIPFWRSKEVIEKFNRKVTATDLFISREKYFEIKNKFGVPQPNDILLTSVGTLGIPYLVENHEPFYFKDGNLTWIRNIDEEKLNPKYLYKWLASQNGRDSLAEITIGSTQEALTIIGLKNLNLLLPPLEEQKAIAEVLSGLDDKIDLLHRQNKTLEELAQALFRQWFIEEVKEEWEIGTLEDIVDFNPTYKLKKGVLATYLAMESVQTNKSSSSGWYTREMASGAKFMNNDTLLARITPSLENGKTAFVDFLDDNEIGWGSTEFIVMRMKEDYHPFVSYLIARNQDFRDFAIGNMTGSTGRQRAQAEDLKKYEIVIPPFQEIEILNKLLEPIPPKLKANWQQIQTLENLRDTLLPKLMSGEVRVK